MVLFHVTNKSQEIDFELENRPYTFVDMETGEKMRLQPSEIKRKNTEDIQTYFNEVKLRCAKFNIDFMPADINEGYDQILLKYLIKRAKMV